MLIINTSNGKPGFNGSEPWLVIIQLLCPSCKASCDISFITVSGNGRSPFILVIWDVGATAPMPGSDRTGGTASPRSSSDMVSLCALKKYCYLWVVQRSVVFPFLCCEEGFCASSCVLFLTTLGSLCESQRVGILLWEQHLRANIYEKEKLDCFWTYTTPTPPHTPRQLTKQIPGNCSWIS